jgi:hypothetical protein
LKMPSSAGIATATCRSPIQEIEFQIKALPQTRSQDRQEARHWNSAGTSTPRSKKEYKRRAAASRATLLNSQSDGPYVPSKKAANAAMAALREKQRRERARVLERRSKDRKDGAEIAELRAQHREWQMGHYRHHLLWVQQEQRRIQVLLRPTRRRPPVQVRERSRQMRYLSWLFGRETILIQKIQRTRVLPYMELKRLAKEHAWRSAPSKGEVRHPKLSTAPWTLEGGAVETNRRKH